MSAKFVIVAVIAAAAHYCHRCRTPVIAAVTLRWHFGFRRRHHRGYCVETVRLRIGIALKAVIAIAATPGCLFLQRCGNVLQKGAVKFELTIGNNVQFGPNAIIMYQFFMPVTVGSFI